MNSTVLSNVRYYQILGLKRTDATPEQIKRAYREMAVKTHPDRNQNDPDSTTKFQEVSQAYTILSSKRMRQVYDSYGEQGLKMYESYLSFAESDDGHKLPIGPVMMLLLACFGVSLLIILLTTFGALLLLRLDGAIEPSLAVLLVPLWIVDAIALCCLYVGFAGMRSRLASLTMTALQLLGFICFQVLLCIHVDGVAPFSYLACFVPLFIIELGLAARAVIKVRPNSYRGESQLGNTLLPYEAYVVQTVFWVLARTAFLVLLALRLDGRLTCAWTLVLLPMWLLLLLELVLAYIAASTKENVTERSPALRQLARARIVIVLLLAIMLLLLCLRLDAQSVGWIAIFWPIFGAAGIYFCCCCCVGVALGLAPKPEPRDVPPMDESPEASTCRPEADGEDAPLLSKGAVAV